VNVLLAHGPGRPGHAPFKTRIWTSRVLAPSEARALEDLPPFTDEQLAEFDRVYGAPRSNPVPATTTSEAGAFPHEPW
jgi:hypothetical protein